MQWLSSSGAYGLLAVVWLLTAIGYAMYAGRLGRRFDAPNDGCLLGFACQVLLITGGAIGLKVLDFPGFCSPERLGRS